MLYLAKKDNLSWNGEHIFSANQYLNSMKTCDHMLIRLNFCRRCCGTRIRVEMSNGRTRRDRRYFFNVDSYFLGPRIYYIICSFCLSKIYHWQLSLSFMKLDFLVLISFSIRDFEFYFIYFTILVDKI